MAANRKRFDITAAMLIASIVISILAGIYLAWILGSQ